MNCDYCKNEFKPKQRFCSAKCRVYHKRGRDEKVVVDKPKKNSKKSSEISKVILPTIEKAGELLAEVAREVYSKPKKKYLYGCDLHGLMNCRFGTCRGK